MLLGDAPPGRGVGDAQSLGDHMGDLAANLLRCGLVDDLSEHRVLLYR